MISIKRTKFINSLQNKKYRYKANAFVAEGVKICTEILQAGWPVDLLLLSPRAQMMPQLAAQASEVVNTSEQVINSVSYFKTNLDCLAIVRMPAPNPPKPATMGWHLAVDGIRDPGNLGAMLRIADWFGFDSLVCSPDCVDAFNPKVVAASMGSFLRVPVGVANLHDYLQQAAVPVFGAQMHGQAAHKQTWPTNGVLVVGNESAGIRPNVLPPNSNSVTIARLGGAESLNAAMAVAVLCDRIKNI